MGHHCCSKQRVKRGLWSPEEDDKLIRHITIHGHGSWSSVPKLSGLERCGKSCRLRWINYLRPDLKKGSFSEQEERTIIEVHRMLGNRWAQIAKHLPGRTDNEVKNFWNSSIKKKLIAQGLDPNTHNLISYTQNNKKPYPPLSLPLASHASLSALILTKQEQGLVDSSLTFPSSGFGVLDNSCMWDGNLQPTSNLQIVTEMEDDQKLSHVLDHQINGFDFDFMDSILHPPNCGMYHNLASSMDQLAWD